MNLLEDAQIQFEELEASFFHVLRERNLSWFGRLIDLKPGDDTLPLLSLTRKPYRDLLLANTISVFDYRIYLLALQCSLLGKAGRVADAGRKAASFLSGFGRRLRDSKARISPGRGVLALTQCRRTRCRSSSSRRGRMRRA